MSAEFGCEIFGVGQRPSYPVMQRLFWVCFAGALGTGVRYLIGIWAGQRFESAYPVATLMVNLVGCFLIAIVMQLSLHLGSFPPGLRVVLTTGFMGGLTTYSAFNYETTKAMA